MINSIRVKLIAIYAAVILIVMIVSGTVMLLSIRGMEIERTRDQLHGSAITINAQIVQQYERAFFNDAVAWRFFGQGQYDIQGIIMTEAGVPIAPEAFVGMWFNDAATAAAQIGEVGFSVGRPGPDLDGITQQWLSFAMPVTREADGETFIVFTRISTQFMNEGLSSIALTLVITVLSSLVLTLVLWIFLANTITAPIVNLTRHAKAIAAGVASKISTKSTDEIGQLIVNFNHMEQELSSSLQSITSERNKQEAILQNTSHGVLAYEATGSLAHANNASFELLPAVDLKNFNLEDTLHFLGLDPQEVYSLDPEEIREVTFQDKDYFILACVTSYRSQSDKISGYIIVLQDVSRQMKLDNMRKEFVANVSHELRTPLTSIRTYAETLGEGMMVDDPVMAKDFLKVIEDEAQRMTLLVSDLLELSRIDSKQSAIEMDVVDLVALLRVAVRQSEVLAGAKSQTIEVETYETPCFVEANAARINQVITNILSNAIKYSPENTVIKVAMETTDKYYRISIIDQGMGIPAESLPRIFERFYRVDKARARAMGGTGLGLSIVKEIMEEHGGRVHITSQFGEGTTMTLRFNRYEI